MQDSGHAMRFLCQISESFIVNSICCFANIGSLVKALHDTWWTKWPEEGRATVGACSSTLQLVWVSSLSPALFHLPTVSQPWNTERRAAQIHFSKSN